MRPGKTQSGVEARAHVRRLVRRIRARFSRRDSGRDPQRVYSQTRLPRRDAGQKGPAILSLLS